MTQLPNDDVLHSLTAHAVELTESDGGRLHARDPRRHSLTVLATVTTPRSFMEDVFQRAARTTEAALRSGGQPVIDVMSAPAEECPTSLAALPICLEGETIGVLELVKLSGRAYDEKDIDALNRLNDLAAIAIRRSRVGEAATLRNEQLTTINRVACAVSGTLNLEDLTNVVYQQVKAAFELDAFFLALYDDATGELDYCFQVDGRTKAPRERRVLGEGLTASVIRRQQPLLIRDFDQECESLPPVELWGTMRTPGSWLGVPMPVGDRTVGVISVQSYHPQAYDERDQELLSGIAEQVAVALGNTQLYERTSRRLAQCQVLRDVMLAAASTLDFDLVLERTLKALHSTVGAECIGFAIPDERRKSLQLHPSQIGFPPEAERVTLKLDSSICGRVFLTGEPMLVNDVRECETYYEGRAETRAELAVPVALHEEVVGVLNVESSRSSVYSDEDLDFYGAIASQLKVALENARLFEAESRQRQQTEALEEAAAVVSGTLNLDQVLDRILEQVERVVPGDAFNVVLIRHGEGARVVGRRGYDVEDQGVKLLSVEEYPFLLQMIATGKPVVVPDTAVEPRWILKEGEESWRSYVGAPIKVGDGVAGFLNVNSMRPEAFNEQHSHGLQAFAHHAAAAIENAELYEELHRYANTLEKRVDERTAQLRGQYAQLETILDSTTDGIVLTSADGELVVANPVARKWLEQMLPPREARQLRDAVEALAARADAKPEVVLELTGVDLQLTAAPVRKPVSKDAKAVVAIHDVSHLKTLSRMKTRFVSNVSHELRTPIATIKLLAHLMQEQPDKCQEYLQPLMQEAEHQAKLVRDILDMCRVDAGRLEIHAEKIDLNALVSTAIDKYSSQTDRRTLSLRHESAKPAPIALADPRWVTQVVDNLLSNAVRYTPPGGSIEVTTASEVSSGRQWATITVSDTGIGIPDDELPYIFDRFYRGEKPQAMQVSGTGLGLAILKDIVDLHGGQVTVESTVGAGSSFTVWLPAKSDQ